MDKDDYWTSSGDLPGILNWALQGLRRLQANRWCFTVPASCRAAVSRTQREGGGAARVWAGLRPLDPVRDNAAGLKAVTDETDASRASVAP
jgi:hypothetical protein